MTYESRKKEGVRKGKMEEGNYDTLKKKKKKKKQESMRARLRKN